jgi:hypothetical protein
MEQLNTMEASFLEAEDADRHLSLAIGTLAVIDRPMPDVETFTAALCERIQSRQGREAVARPGWPTNNPTASAVLFRRQITLFDRLHKLISYAFQIGGAMGLQLVLPGRHPHREVLIGDGAFQPVRKVASFEMVFECLVIEMSHRIAEVMHARGRRVGFAVGRVKVEPPFGREAYIGVFVQVPYVCGTALRDGEPARRPRSETDGGPPS